MPRHDPLPLDVLRCPLDGMQLIEASAGTGKTWAICALYLRLLLEQRREVQHILVVTFTKAATAELRERIRARLADALAQLATPNEHDPLVPPLLQRLREAGHSDDELARRLALALHSFDEAAIFTIHGFCQRALGDAAFAAQMPLQMALTADDALLRQQVVNDFWRQHVAGDTLPAALADHLMARGDSPERWAQLLARQLGKPTAQLRWPAALDGPGHDVDTSALSTAWATLRTLWAGQRQAIVAQLLAGLSQLNGTSYKREAVHDGAAEWDAQLAADSPLDAPGKKALLFSAGHLAAKTKKDKVTPRHGFFDAVQDWLDAQAAVSGALEMARLRLIRQLLAEAPVALTALKRERRVVAFDDMLANLHQRLVGSGGAPAAPWLAQALRQRFPAALIDEFQDTDPLQFEIFRTIYTTPVDNVESERPLATPLFLVGDPKQAIYSFRNADLHTYLAARAQTRASYTLNQNQRAVGPLIDAMNALFTAQADPFMMDGLDYVPVTLGAKPRPPLVDRTLAGHPRAPLQLWALPVDGDKPRLRKADALAGALQATAHEIARLVAAGQRGDITLGGQPLTAGHIAVLVRSHRQGALARQALAALGVGSVELSQASVFHSPDADDLARVLAAVLEPTREPLLKAALATLVLGWTAPQLLALADDEQQLLERVQRLADWRALWLQRGVGTMLRTLLRDEAVARRLLARPDGERRLTNLLHLAECLHQAAQDHPAPEALLRWLQAQREGRSADEGTQLRLESDRHLVQIITIHKSKGLEYPIVFCPTLWDGRSNARGDGLDGQPGRDADGQVVIDFALAERGAEALAANKQMQRLDSAAEDLRLIYVALTRAVHRCHVVCGGYTASASTKESQRSLLNWLVAGGGHSPADWLAPEPAAGVAQIQAAWAALADGSGGCINLSPWPAGPGVPVQPVVTAPDTLAALPPPAVLPLPWRIGSYSGLVHGARHEAAAQDHDLRTADAADVADAAQAAYCAADVALPAAPVSAGLAGAAGPMPAAPAIDDVDDILNFPRGAAAGDALHLVFETIDFTAPPTWPGAVQAALALHGARLAGAADAEAQARHARQLQRVLADVLATPLPVQGIAAEGHRADLPPLRLDQVPLGRRLTELAFHLPAPSLSLPALNSLLARHGYPGPQLTGQRLRGWLQGFIDSVVMHAGRFYIIDWKSNHLGERPGDYATPALAQAMAREGYHLQQLLYAVALQRWLAQRVAGYQADLHFGGVLYLFVRGVRPGWVDAQGQPLGAWLHRPPQAVLDELSALLGHAAEPTEAAR